MKPSRYPPLKKIDGKIVCRGCGAAVPKGRQTWCSNKCYETHCPQVVCSKVRQRDKHICQICKKDIRQLQNERFAIVIPKMELLPGENHVDRWHRQNKLERQLRGPEIREEYDHIIPFAFGGKTVLENMRTVCSPCHKKTPTYGGKIRKLKREQTQRPLLMV